MSGMCSGKQIPKTFERQGLNETFTAIKFVPDETLTMEAHKEDECECLTVASPA